LATAAATEAEVGLYAYPLGFKKRLFFFEPLVGANLLHACPPHYIRRVFKIFCVLSRVFPKAKLAVRVIGKNDVLAFPILLHLVVAYAVFD
jgi:hypothetical protein